MELESVALGGLWYVAFLLALTCHEAAHALVALWGGDNTAAVGGQVTLNPLPHVRREPLGMVAVPLLSFALNGWMLGWASAPYSQLWEHRYPRRAALMALAGPGANLILAILAGILIHAGIYAGIFQMPASITFFSVVEGVEGESAAAQILSILFTQNILLVAFNLMPMPPLDGNTAVGLIVPRNTARKWFDVTRNQPYDILGLMVAWYFFSHFFWPVLGFAVKLLYWN